MILSLCYEHLSYCVLYSASVPMFITAFPNTRTCTAPVQHELVNLDFVEFSYVDDVLAEMKITPDKIEIPIPAYFKRDRTNELQYWDNLLKATTVNIEFRLTNGLELGLEQSSN